MNAPYFVEPATEVFLKQAMHVMAGRYVRDHEGRDAEVWTQILDDNDFFRDLTLDMKRMIIELAALNSGTAYNRLYNHLVDCVEEVVKEEA